MSTWWVERSAAPQAQVDLSSDPELKGLFDACDRIERVVLDSFPHGQKLPPLDPMAIAWVVIMRCLKTLDALLLAANSGYGPQAMMLARTLVEDAVTAWWCTVQEGSTLVDLLEKHERSVGVQIQGGGLVTTLRSLEGVPVLKSGDEAPPWGDGVDGKVAFRHWTGKSVKAMASQIGSSAPPDVNEAMTELLKLPYLLTNLAVHNSPAAMNTAMARYSKGSDASRGKSVISDPSVAGTMSRQPSVVLVHDALAVAFDALFLVAKLVATNDQGRQYLAARAPKDRAAFSLLRLDRTPGRNEPCPCESGRKFKSCHGR